VRLSGDAHDSSDFGVDAFVETGTQAAVTFSYMVR
jgi:hypothetical protein